MSDNKFMLPMQMVGGRQKIGLQVPLKSKSAKANKPKKPVCGVQKTIDSFQAVTTDNSDPQVDYEAPINTEGMKWVDVNSDSEGLHSSQCVSQSLDTQQQQQTHTRSWADVASPRVNTPSSPGLNNSEGTSLQHKTDIPPVFLSYACMSMYSR